MSEACPKSEIRSLKSKSSKSEDWSPKLKIRSLKTDVWCPMSWSPKFDVRNSKSHVRVLLSECASICQTNLYLCKSTKAQWWLLISEIWVWSLKSNQSVRIKITQQNSKWRPKNCRFPEDNFSDSFQPLDMIKFEYSNIWVVRDYALFFSSYRTNSAYVLRGQR